MATTRETYELAVENHRLGRLSEAEDAYRRILATDPNHPGAWNHLGIVAAQTGMIEAAVECIRRAVELKPEYAEAYVNLGMAYREQGKPQEAEACFGKACELGLVDISANAGNIELPTEVLPVSTSRRQLLLGNTQYDLGKLREAADSYRAGLAADPDSAELCHNLGSVLLEMGEIERAEQSWSRALDLQPRLAKTHRNRSQLRLLRGDFERGWPEFEWRWKTGELPLRDFSQPRWEGQPLDGKAILLHTEQGFGDTYQFIRYAPLVKKLGGRVIVECPKVLMPLLSNCPGIDQLVGAGDKLPGFDFHSPLLSLPGVFETRLETIPVNVPYLFAEAGLVELWRERLKGESGFRVGANWQGRSGQGFFRRRDFPVESFEPLTRLQNVRLVNLHKGEGRRELAELSDRLAIIDLGDDVDARNGAFMDTAAVMMNLDLVITSDTSIAHLAGALGVPVWVALPFVPDWRWLLDRNDSPWYPTMRLFRQKSLGDWSSVFGEMEAAVRSLL